MEPPASAAPTITVKVTYAKVVYDVVVKADGTVADLKAEIEKMTKVPVALQKLMFGGILKNDAEALAAKKIVNGTKMMLIGSNVSDVLAVNAAPSPSSSGTDTSLSNAPARAEPLSRKEEHKKVIAEGAPEDAIPGIKGRKMPLPNTPLNGILTKRGKVRLTFKNDAEELWIGSSTSTQKLPYKSIAGITSEPIEGKEEYHIMILQLGASENSKLYLYFVPAQYADAIKDTIMGGFVYF